MKRKEYIIPAFWQIEMNIQKPLLEASITDTKMEDFTEELETGGTTDEADSRSSKSIWNDEEEEDPESI